MTVTPSRPQSFLSSAAACIRQVFRACFAHATPPPRAEVVSFRRKGLHTNVFSNTQSKDFRASTGKKGNGSVGLGCNQASVYQEGGRRQRSFVR
jgi:hypothetical protein